MFNIIEKFVSIDGEGPTAGELATFIRFQGCNLRCSWCDTTYSFDKSEITEVLSAEEIYDYIKSTGVSNVTLTGGEPLFQKNIDEVLSLLNDDKNLVVHIETNGACTPPDTSKSPAYCFSQPPQGTYLIRLKFVTFYNDLCIPLNSNRKRKPPGNHRVTSYI